MLFDARLLGHSRIDVILRSEQTEARLSVQQAITLREALALCCYAKVEHRDRQAFNEALEEPNGGRFEKRKGRHIVVQRCCSTPMESPLSRHNRLRNLQEGGLAQPRARIWSCLALLLVGSVNV